MYRPNVIGIKHLTSLTPSAASSTAFLDHLRWTRQRPAPGHDAIECGTRPSEVSSSTPTCWNFKHRFSYSPHQVSSSSDLGQSRKRLERVLKLAVFAGSLRHHYDPDQRHQETSLDSRSAEHTSELQSPC